MLFSNNNNTRFITLNSNYLNNYKVGVGILDVIKVDDRLFPYGVSSIDKSYKTIYKKSYNEYLERTRIGYNTFLDKEIKIFDYINCKVKFGLSKYIGYEYNKVYGFLDTTGTSSGLNSYELIKKSLYELLEKNELMLLWYKRLGKKIIVTNKIKSIINEIGFKSEKLFIYLSSNISSGFCVTVIVINNNKIVCSGIAFDTDSMEALIKALMEAKLFEVIYNNSIYSPIFTLNDKEHEIVYDYLCCLNSSIECIMIESINKVNNKLILSDWISNIDFAILNTNKYQNNLTIRCLSEALICCLPTKKILNSICDKKIIKYYDIISNLNKCPDCIVY